MSTSNIYNKNILTTKIKIKANQLNKNYKKYMNLMNYYDFIEFAE